MGNVKINLTFSFWQPRSRYLAGGLPEKQNGSRGKDKQTRRVNIEELTSF
jgi:hypothetical protein